MAKPGETARADSGIWTARQARLYWLALTTTAITRPLHAARRRLLAQRFGDWLCACLLAAGGCLLAAGAFNLARGGAVFSVAWLAIVLALAAGAACLGTAAGWIDLGRAAQVLDTRARTHDRFHTALAFSLRTPPLAPFEEHALAECTRFITAFPVRRWTPLRLPRAARFLPVPALALALLCWHASLRLGQPPANPALDGAIARRAAALAILAEKIKPTAQKAPNSDLERLAAEMKRSAERLRQSAAAENGSDKLKGALGEISSLEAMLAAMKQAAAEQQQASPAELAALRAALQTNALTQDAAKSMEGGKLEQAASQLEAQLAKMQQQGNAAEALAQLAQSMQEQAAKLTAAEKNEVARQMQQAAQAAQAGQSQLSAQSMQHLADLLRKIGRQGAPGQSAAGGATTPGTALTPAQLQNLLNALENMKTGLPDQGNGSAPGTGKAGSGSPGEQSALALVESFAQRPGDSPQGAPSGLPGSEHDSGTNEKLFADTPPPAVQKPGAASRLEGMLGEGQSLQELVGAGGDRSKAGRPYRELYEAMAPAAQDAVEQEDIPLGSRFFIQRYFESIRPP